MRTFNGQEKRDSVTRFPAPTEQKPLMISTRTRPFTTSSCKTTDSCSRGSSFFKRSTVWDTIFFFFHCHKSKNRSEMNESFFELQVKSIIKGQVKRVLI